MKRNECKLVLIFLFLNIAVWGQDFRLTFDTTNGSGGTMITLPMNGAHLYDVDIDNDGDFAEAGSLINVSGSQVIDLGTAGVHTIRIRPNPTNNTGKQLRIRFAGGNDAEKLTRIEQWGDIVWTSMESAFYGCSNMNISATAGAPNLSQVINMTSIFQGAANLNQDLNNWDTSNVTNLHDAFKEASAFNGDISNWNTSNVDRMSFMFGDAFAFNQDIDSWNVSKVTNMTGMFFGASSFNQDLSSWNVAAVTNMNYMFAGTSVFNGNITNWNTQNVEGMAAMFYQAAAFNQAIGGWNTSKVTLMNSMFSAATVFNQDISGWDVSSVTQMNNMFQQTDDFDQDLSGWDTSGITGSMAFMFNGAKAFNQNIGGWNVSGATSMASMFNGAEKFNQDLSSWNTGNVTDMTAMFSAATDFNGNVSTWNTAKVTKMLYMFSIATSFNQDIGDWNVSAVDDMTGMMFSTTSFSTENYDNLLTGWGSRSVQSPITFRAPPTTFCAGAVGRKALIDAGWTIEQDAGILCSDHLVLTFNTTTDAPGNKTIDLPVSGVAYDVDIDGDGVFGDTDDASVVLENLTVKQTITFATAGEHTIRVRPNPVNNLTKQLRINFDGDAMNNPQKLTSVEQWGNIVWTTMEKAFYGCSNMNISASAGIPDLSQVFNMAFMFQGASSLNQDLSGWNVSTVTNMQGLFFEATTFNGNVSTWNVENVTNMAYVFASAPAFNQALNSWNVSKVIYMNGLFSGATLFNQNLSSWNTSTVTAMNDIFLNATSFNQNLNNWDTSSVTSLHNAFKEARAFNGNISSWNTSSVTAMGFMFANAIAFNQDINSWNVSKVTTMAGLFYGASAFNKPLNSWNVSNVTFMNAMFIGASIFNQDLNSWNVSKVTAMNSMFQNATAFNGNISSWNVSTVVSMSSMFNGASVFNQDVSSWNTSSVTDMTATFAATTAFNGNVSGWNTENVTAMSAMFSSASNFNQDVGSWNISKVTTMAGFLSAATSFSTENYDKLLIGWSAQTVQLNVPFGPPPTGYCDGVAGRALLIKDDAPTDNNWDFGNSEVGMSCPDLVLKFDTTLGSGGTTIILPISIGSYDVDIDNDGDYTDTGSLVNVSGTRTIDYGTGNGGVKTIRIRPNLTNNATKQLRINYNSANDAEKLTSIEQWGETIVWTSMENAFRGCTSMNISATAGSPNLSMVEDMTFMFYGASSLAQDLNNWNVSNVTNMADMFSNASIFNGNISSWDTASVTNMSHMFQNAIAFNGDINGWNVSKVTTMTSMFSQATSFNKDLNAWNVSGVTNMANMFSSASAFNGNISNWNTGNVTEMWSMFYQATTFNGDINGWNVSKVITMTSMFSSASSFNQSLSSWNLSVLDRAPYMFNNASSFNQDISTWNISKITNMADFLSGATSFSASNYDKLLIAWSALTFESTFNFGAPPTTYCEGEEGKNVLIDTHGWNITGDTGRSCTETILTFNTTLGDSGNMTIELPITVGAYDVDLDNNGIYNDTDATAKVLNNLTGTQTITFSSMGSKTIRIRPNSDSNPTKELQIVFAGANAAQKLTSIDSWGGVVWTSMEKAFQGCTNLNIGISAGVPDLSSVTNMNFMFENATSVNADLSTWNITNVTSMVNFFTGATSFSSGNYDKLLVGWAAQTVQSNVSFGAPSVKYCLGAEARAILRGGPKNWVITGDLGPFCGDMTLTFNTEAGDPGNKTIILPISDGVYDVDINNDGVYEGTDFAASPVTLTNVTGTQTITFENPGVYTIRIRPNNSNNQLRIAFAGANAAQKLTTIHNWGADIAWTSMEDAFNGCTNMNMDASAGAPNLSAVTNMSNMFAGATAFNGILSGWNTSTITNMSGTFNGANAFNQDLSTWDVSNVTSMQNMFNNASVFNRNISGWDISKVQYMEDFLTGATSFSKANYDNLLTVWSNLIVYNPVTFGVPPTNYCAGAAGKADLETNHGWTFDGDLGPSCSDEMILRVEATSTFRFEGLTIIWSHVVVLPISDGAYDVDMNNDGQFSDTDAESNYLVGLSGTRYIYFNSSGTYTIRIRPSSSNSSKQLRIAYAGISTANKLRIIEKWSDNIVWTSMERAFEGCSNLIISGNAGAPNLSQVANMNTMFKNASIVNTDLNAWNVSNVTSMQEMFGGATSFNQDLNSWNVSGVVNMDNMFANATAFNGDISSWNTTSVTSMADTFNGATSFNQDVSSWNVSGVITMENMFLGATGFSSTNYDKLLNGWSSRAVQSGVPFGAPPTSYCDGNAGKVILEGTPNNWVFSGDSGSSCSDLILTFNTELDDPGNKTIVLPMSDGAYDIDFNNDGVYGDTDFSASPQSLDNLSGTKTITFETPGIYTIRIRTNSSNVNSQLRIYYNSGNQSQKLLSIDQWGGSIVWTSMSGAFYGCSNLTISTSAGAPDLSMVTDVSIMFYGAASFNQDISHWNVSNVTDMSFMFYNATSFNKPLDTWNVSSVTNMLNMFWGATSFNQSLNSWNTSNVTNMSSMFRKATSFNGNIDSWNVSKVTDVKWMFEGATSFDQSINTWNTSDITSMSYMFEGATSFNQTLNSWNTSKVQFMTSMFSGATSFNGNISDWNTSNVTSMTAMFSGATSFNGNISDWNTSNITSMGAMFKDASSFNGNISGWDTAKVTNMSSMFKGAINFNGNVSALNTSSVTSMSEMFNGATAFNQDVSGWNVSKIAFMTDMFSGAIRFSSANYDALLTAWSALTFENTITFGAPPTTYCNGEAGKTDLVENHSWTITGDSGKSCTDLTLVFDTQAGSFGNNTIVLPIFNGAYDVDIDNDGIYGDVDGTSKSLTNLTNNQTITFSTPGVYTIRIRPNNSNLSKQMQIYFNNLSVYAPLKLTSIENWGDSIVWLSMQNAFYGCENMNIAANAGAPDLSIVTNMLGTFREARSMNQDLNSWNVSNVTNMFALFGSANAFNGNISSWNVSNVEIMSFTFSNAHAFNQDISSWNVSKATSMTAMFNFATAFNQDISSWNILNATTMANMFNAATSFSSENYDKLLIAWAALGASSGRTFTQPPATYCAGSTAKETLEGYGWSFNGVDAGEDCSSAGVKVSLKLFLRGAYDTNTGMMIDSLRSKSHIPMLTPHTDGISAAASVFNTTGNDAIVDWVYVELRDKNDINTVLHGVSAFIQRDGDIVGVDGSSEVNIAAAAADNYHVTVSHRNHIPIATSTTISLSSTTTVIDLTKVENILGGSLGTMEISPGIRAVWGGDFNGDGQVKTDDLLMGLAQGNLGTSGYRTTDFNMDGQAQSLELITTLLAAIGKGKQF